MPLKPSKDEHGHSFSPTTPTLFSISNPPSQSRTSSRSTNYKSLVEDPSYRYANLADNGIHFREDYNEELPNHISNLLTQVRKGRNSPGPSIEDLKKDMNLKLLEAGAAEPAVETYFQAKIFHDPEWISGLKRIDKSPMFKYQVPSNPLSKFKVSTPCPDSLYGYNRTSALLSSQQIQLRSCSRQATANSQGLLYPFLAIKFKADGPGHTGSLWVATNQCLGASTSCINIAEHLNDQLKQCKNEITTPIDTTAFSIAMNGTEARLYVSWKQNELDYYMQRVDSFLLGKPEDFIQFRRCVKNILDWGCDQRLNEIKKSLDVLLEENRKMASKEMRERSPLSSGAASGAEDKRRWGA